MRRILTTLLAALSATLLLRSTPPDSLHPTRDQAQAQTTTKETQSSAQSEPRTARARSSRPDRPSPSAPPLELHPALRQPQELRGIWITTDSPRDWDSIMRSLRSHGLNAAFVRVAQGGKAIYPSRILPQDRWAEESGGDELAKAVHAAHRHGIQLHAWKVCFHMSSSRYPKYGAAVNQFYQKMADQDRFVRDSQGRQSYWLNPADPRNQELEIQVAREVVQNYPVDGYHLDYIRYPDSTPGFDFHFGDISRREFSRVLGKPVASWPEDVISGPLKLRYEQWERDNITELVRQIGGAVRAQRPGTQLSAAVWRNIHLYGTRLKQDWPRWGRERLLDFLVLMLYETDLDEFRSKLRRELSYVCGDTPFMAGVGIWQIPSSSMVVDQVRASRDAGADGFVLFSINDPTDSKGVPIDAGRVDRHLSALSSELTRVPAPTGLGGPRLKFSLSSEAAPRRYEPRAIESAQPARLTIRLLRAGTRIEEIPVAVAIEDLQGQTVAGPRSITLRTDVDQVIPLVAHAAAVRPVVRGLRDSQGTLHPFVIRGPIVEPLSGSDLLELRARRLPPQLAGPGPHVGVYFHGLGAEGIYRALEQAHGIEPVYIHHLEPSHLARLHVLVLPQLYDLSDVNGATAQALRTWVHNGGRIILTRDAVGMRWHPRLFPEVGMGSRLVAQRGVRVAGALRGFTPGKTFDHERGDHVQLEVSSSAKILLAEAASGKPVVAAGQVGKGLVILNGLLPGYAEEAAPLSQSSRLLVALVSYQP